MKRSGESLLAAVRQSLADFAFHQLFIEDLGWDHAHQVLHLAVGGEDVTLSAVGQKRGFVAYECTGPDGQIPEAKTRAAIERELTKQHYEHLIVFVDKSHTEQIWLWVRRDSRKPLAKREQHFRRGQSGEALAQRLLGVYFSLDEEAALTLPEVTGRARRAFDVDRVTRRFYDQYKAEQAAFTGFITGIEDLYDRTWYGALMLNRLMFVYFIQKKGFLAGDPDYLRRRLQTVRGVPGTPGFLTFYRYFLRRLFHEGFGTPEHSPELEALVGSVPYLNGGLFEVHKLEQDYPETDIPDDAFERVFDFFDSYQWHLDDRPLRNDNEINPDVLGYIFEKYVNQKQMGAYYSKEDITGHIAANSVLPKLLSIVQIECAVAFDSDSVLMKSVMEQPERYLHSQLLIGVTDALPESVLRGVHDVDQRVSWNQYAPSTYALPLETWRDVVARRSVADAAIAAVGGGEWSLSEYVRRNVNLRQLAQDVLNYSEGPEVIRAFYKALTSITILDPTCGSGAFLFAALNILEPLYEGCLERMQAHVDEADRLGEAERHRDFREILQAIEGHPNRAYFIYKSIIVSNLFGVDIMEEAVEICKLRLYLKLMSQAPSATHVEPLPDIDFNIQAGNALVGFATLQEARAAIGEVLDLGEGTMGALENDARQAAAAFARFQQLQLDQSGSSKVALAEHKRELNERRSALRDTLDVALASRYSVIAGTKKWREWRRSHAPFHWCVEFYATMASGGFDSIIGNPPYVEYRLISGQYQLPPGLYRSEEVGNLYAFCLERSAQLLADGGWFGMIVPAGFTGVDEALPIREALCARYQFAVLSTYSIRPSKLFEGVDQRLCIILATAASGDTWYSSRYHHWHAEERAHLFTTLEYASTAMHRMLHRLPQVGSQQSERILGLLQDASHRTVGHHYTGNRAGDVIHYHRSPRYWIRAMDFDPYFSSATRTRSIHHIRDLWFPTPRAARIVGALLNSSLFFFWFLTIGNGRNLTGSDVALFPVGDLEDTTLDALPPLFLALMKDYQKHSFTRVRRDQEYQEFQPSLSKSKIDDIDRALALHYGLNDNDVDFIVNYEIRYRLGEDEAAGETEEA